MQKDFGLLLKEGMVCRGTDIRKLRHTIPHVMFGVDEVEQNVAQYVLGTFPTIACKTPT